MAAERMEKPGPYDPGFGIRSISAGLIAQLQVNTESARGLKISSQRSGERKRVGHVAVLGQIPAPGSQFNIHVANIEILDSDASIQKPRCGRVVIRLEDRGDDIGIIFQQIFSMPVSVQARNDTCTIRKWF